MKKTILAMAVASLFTGATAQAATIFEQEHLTIDVYGDLEVIYINKINEKEQSDGTFKDEDPVIDIDDADFGFELGCNIGTEVSVTAVLEFTGEGDDVELDDAFVGFVSDKWGSLTVGQQVTIFDDAGIGSDYQFGFNDFFEQDVASTQVIKYTVDAGTFYGGIAYLLNNATGSDDNEHAIDGKVGMRFADFDFVVFYGDSDTVIDDEIVESTNLNFELYYTLGDIGLAAAYSTRDVETNGGSEVTTDAYGLAATYQMGKAQFAVGWALIDGEDQDTINDYYINASYAYTNSVNMYVEVGDSDDDNTEFGYVAGMQVTF